MTHPRRRRSSRLPRLPLRRPAAAVRGTEWTAGGGLDDPDRRLRPRRALAVFAALLELGVLAWLVAGGAFTVRDVRVTGNQRLSTAAVRRLGGLDQPQTVFAVDAATIRRKLTADAWVRDAQVTPVFPGRVDVSVQEWQPAAVFVAGSARHAFYLSDQAVVLGSARGLGDALEVDAPAAGDPRTGQRPLDVRLLTALVNIQRGLPGQVGQNVRSFEIDGCGNLTMTAGRGWKAYFGRVITSEEFGSLNAKLAALKAVSTAQDLNSADLDYINLMNSSLPAVELKSKAPAPAPTPARVPSPAPSALAPVVTCR